MLSNEALLLPVSRTVNNLIVNVQALCYTDACRNLGVGGDLTFLQCKNQHITKYNSTLDVVRLFGQTEET
jgi:hypothetical protein